MERRVGKEKLVALLEAVSHSEHYVKAAQRPQPFAKVPQDLFLEFHFVKFFKNTEGETYQRLYNLVVCINEMWREIHEIMWRK